MNVGTIEQMIRDMKSGVYNMTKNGECSQCGQCCSDILPVSNLEIGQIRRYIAKHHVQEQKHTPPTAQPVEDFTCPFRNNVDRRCEIYPVRPAICRDFRCDKPQKMIELDAGLYCGRYEVIRMRKEFYGEQMK